MDRLLAILLRRWRFNRRQALSDPGWQKPVLHASPFNAPMSKLIPAPSKATFCGGVNSKQGLRDPSEKASSAGTVEEGLAIQLVLGRWDVAALRCVIEEPAAGDRRMLSPLERGEERRGVPVLRRGGRFPLPISACAASAARITFPVVRTVRSRDPILSALR